LDGAFAPTFRENLTKAIETLRRILEEQQTSVAVIDEPPLKPSNDVESQFVGICLRRFQDDNDVTHR